MNLEPICQVFRPLIGLERREMASQFPYATRVMTFLRFRSGATGSN